MIKIGLRHNQRGIMISEVLLVIFLISIVALIAIPRYLTVRDNSQYEACRTHVANIDALVQQYYIREGTWPLGGLTDIGANINYFPEGAMPACPVTTTANYFITSPTHRVSGHLRNDPSHP